MRAADRDGGFTLLEIIVALGVMMLVMVALLPQLIVGIKSNGTAQFVTQAKGVTQGELERMRNLPFHIAPAAGDFIDVLDHFYPHLAGPSSSPTCMNGGEYVEPQTAWAGYVAPGDGARCPYEPATGAFYRDVDVVTPDAGTGGFTVVTDTQFLSGATPPQPVTPADGYDTQTVGKDTPPSTQIGVTLTVFYTDRGTLRPVSTHTQITQRAPTTMRIRAESSVTAVEVGSVTADGVPLSLSAGLVNLTGSLSHASTANANLAAASAGLATGEQGAGAGATVMAPPTVDQPTTTAPADALSVGGCSYACWGASRLGPVVLTADGALPRAGSTLNPLQSMITELGPHQGFSFGNSTTGYRPALDLTPSLLRLDTDATPIPSGIAGCAPGSGGVSSYVTGSGYLHTTSSEDTADPTVVETCAVARTTPVSLFPTTFAPQGVVKVELTAAAARCRVEGEAHSAAATYDYQAVVSYWDGSAYQQAATIAPGLTVDPLEDLPMSTPVGGGHVLGDYVASWSAITVDKVTSTSAGGRASVTLPGVVNIATQPVRNDPATDDGLDPTSAVSLSVGALACSAEDQR